MVYGPGINWTSAESLGPSDYLGCIQKSPELLMALKDLEATKSLTNHWPVTDQSLTKKKIAR